MSNPRSFVGMLQRMSKSEPKHEASAHGPQKFSAEEDPQATPGELSDDDRRFRSDAPIPLRPGDVIDLETSSQSQEHLFTFKAGAPLPNRGSRFAAVTPAPPAEPAPAEVEAPRAKVPRVKAAPPTEPLQQHHPQITPVRKDYTVTNVDTLLKEAMQIDGAIGVALVDYTSGMTLGQSGGGSLNMDVAAAGNTEVVRAKLRTMEALGLREGIEDILITLDTQYHIIRLISSQSGIGLFLYMALDKKRANLAMARHRLTNLERQIEI
jgi:hypothetical protein